MNTLITMPSTKKKNDDDSSPSSSEDNSEHEFDGAGDTPQKLGVSPGQWSPMRSDADSNDDDDSDENDNNEVSLEAIKKKTLGRNVKSIYDLESPAANLNDDDNDHSKMIMDITSFTDGKTLVPMLSSQDHKRALDGDEGLNTGGMGTVAPNPYYTDEIAEECMKRIFIPTMEAMNSEGRTFKGCLYFGLMLTQAGLPWNGPSLSISPSRR